MCAVMAALFSTAFMFAHDSPVAIGRWSPSLGFSLVLVSAWGVHSYDRHLHRQRLARHPFSHYRPRPPPPLPREPGRPRSLSHGGGSGTGSGTGTGSGRLSQAGSPTTAPAHAAPASNR
jgi:hypothetical protein